MRGNVHPSYFDLNWLPRVAPAEGLFPCAFTRDLRRKPDWRVDLLKLACLLRLADAAQVDARRAPTLLLLIRRPQGESRDHWRFQQYLSRPELHGDLLDYTTVRPFDRPDANAWWLALDYLKMSTTNCVSSTT